MANYEVYAMLRECSMDPNETTQKLYLKGAAAAPKKTVKASDSMSSVSVVGFDGLPREDISANITPNLLKNLGSPDWKIWSGAVRNTNSLPWFYASGTGMEDYFIRLLKLSSCISHRLISFIEDLLFRHNERFSNDFESLLSGCHGRSFSTISQSSEGDCSTCPEYIDVKVPPVERGRRLTRPYEDLSGNGSLGVGGL